MKTITLNVSIQSNTYLPWAIKTRNLYISNAKLSMMLSFTIHFYPLSTHSKEKPNAFHHG